MRGNQRTSRQARVSVRATSDEVSGWHRITRLCHAELAILCLHLSPAYPAAGMATRADFSSACLALNHAQEARPEQQGKGLNVNTAEKHFTSMQRAKHNLGFPMRHSIRHAGRHGCLPLGPISLQRCRLHTAVLMKTCNTSLRCYLSSTGRATHHRTVARPGDTRGEQRPHTRRTAGHVDWQVLGPKVWIIKIHL